MANAPTTAKSPAIPGQVRNLVLATAASVVGFWAWNIIATLSTHYAKNMELSAATMGILVAMPIFVGSLGRIVVGTMTDRFGGRALFTFVLVATIPTVLLVALGGALNSFVLVLAAHPPAHCRHPGRHGRAGVDLHAERTGLEAQHLPRDAQAD